MNCGCEYTSFSLFTGIDAYSRFDHSMGVALIVWNFTKDFSQAMSGLLHDIATPVFAHVIDFLHNDHMLQESTEKATAEFICRSEALNTILRKYNISVDSVVDYHRYPIADNDSPKLSADRLEYTLGNAVNYKIISKEQAAAYYRDLVVGTNEFGETELVFRHREIALAFADSALKCTKIYVSDPDRCAMQSLADLLKEAVKRGILTKSDFNLTETTVINKLVHSELSTQWAVFRNYHKIIRQKEPDAIGCWRRIFAKKRYIDPFVADTGRTSSLFAEYRRELDTFLKSTQDYWLLIQ
jgi:HD superfamily phosphohydrolase